MKTKKTKPAKTHLVEVRWVVAKTYEVEAASRTEAIAEMKQQLDDGQLSYFEDGYESVDGTVVYQGIEKD